MAYDTIQNNGTSLQQRTTLNVTPPISASDNAPNLRTDVLLSIEPTNDGGALAKQAVTPGTQQTGHLSISGTGLFGNQVGIGTAAPDASALLDASSTSRGLLPPRMTHSQRNLIPSPATGLAIHNTVTRAPNFFDGTYWRTLGGASIRVEDYGAVADGKVNSGGTMSAGSTTLTIAAGVAGLDDQFSTADVGKTIWVFRAGVAGGTLRTTISAVNTATNATLAAAAATAVVGARLYWGTDNTTAINAAIAEAADRLANSVEFSFGHYVIDGQVSIPFGNIDIEGQGPGATRISQASLTANTLAFTAPLFSQGIRKMSLHGPGTAQTDGAAIAWPNGGVNFTVEVEGVVVQEFFRGVSLPQGTGNVTLYGVDIFDCGDAGVFVVGGGIIYKRGLVVGRATPLSTLSISLGAPTTVTGASPQFTTKDIGKRIVVNGAGPGGAPLVSTVTAVASATSATIADAASMAVSNAQGRLFFRMSYGIRIQNGGGAYIETVDIVSTGVGLQIDPAMNQSFTFGFFRNLLCDSSWDVGLNIAPTGNGSVTSLTFTNCWFASAGADTNNGPGVNRMGIRISPSGVGATITGIRFDACRIANNGKHGVFAEIAAGSITGLEIQNCDIDGNSGSANGVYDAVIIGTVTDVMFIGNQASHNAFGIGSTDNRSLVMTAATGGLIIVANNAFKHFAAPNPISNSSTTPTQLITNNIPYGPTTHGRLATSVAVKTSAYTIGPADGTILANATAVPFTITLPTAVNVLGVEHTVKKTDASVNAVTLQAAAGQLIDGVNTYSLGTPQKYVTVQSDGSNWVVIANN